MPKRRDENAPYWQQLRFAEKGIIEYALEHGQTIRGTAAILGISPNYLSERTRELGIVVPESRPGPKPGTARPPRADKPNLRVVSDKDAPVAGTKDVDGAAEDEVKEEDEGDEGKGDDEEEGDEEEETWDDDSDEEEGDEDCEDDDQDQDENDDDNAASEGSN